MKIKHLLTALLALAPALLEAQAQEKLIIVNEGLWQTDNGRLSYFEDGNVVSNQWFRDNNGSKLGDTPNDIILVNDNLIAIALNWSNIVQFITPQGKAVAATDDVPNNRKLATDGEYVYVTSFGHECYVNGSYRQFTKGFVAKISLDNYNVVDAVEVGYEPEGIALYNGHLFVANTGGYAFQENHDYETTVSVIDAATMQVTRTIDTGQINLYGKMSRSGRYLCINSPGDYYYASGATIILDCEKALAGLPAGDCFVKLDYSASYNCVDTEGRFFAIGSRYSYLTGDYTFNYLTIDPAEVMESQGLEGVYNDLPGTIVADLKKMSMPYGIYVNPYTGYIYATDAGTYTGAGSLYQWSPEGKLLGTHRLYINPAHFLALPPEGYSGIGTVERDRPSTNSGSTIYNLLGQPVKTPRDGSFYIRNGRKYIHQSH